jgi:hypothetical protein
LFVSELLPETFYLDVARLNEYSKEWRRLASLACIAVLLCQIAGKEKKFEELIKKIHSILSFPSDSNRKDILSLCIKELEAVQSTIFPDDLVIKLESAIAKVLSAHNPLFNLMSVRLGRFFFSVIKHKGKQIDETGLNSNLISIKLYAARLALKLNKLFWHNLAVHDNLYCGILEQIGK